MEVLVMFKHEKQFLHPVRVERPKSTIRDLNARTIRRGKWRT